MKILLRLREEVEAVATPELSACHDAETAAELRLLAEVAETPRLNTSERAGHLAVSLRRDEAR